MRITTAMFYNDLLQSIQQNQDPMLKSQEELSTGLKMNQPSDDPADLGTVMSLSKMIDENNQESSVLSIQNSRLSQADSSLGQAVNILNRAKEIIMEANNGDINSSEQNDMAQEVYQLMQSMIATANNSRGFGPGETFFSWQNVAGSQYTVSNSGSPSVSTDTLSHDSVDPNAIFFNHPVNNSGLGYNQTYYKMSSTSNGPNVLDTLGILWNDLSSNPPNTGNLSQDLQNVSDAANWVIANQAQVGAVEDRVQSQQSQISAQNTNLTQLMAGFKDTDMDQTMVKFSQEQVTYQAALATSAKVMQVSLLNYMTG